MTTEATDSPTRRIVVGVDFDEPGEHALVGGINMAHGMEGAELHLVHVLKVSAEVHSAKKLDKLSDDIEAAHEKLEEHAQKAMASSDADAEAKLAVVSHIRLGQPAKAIHQVAVDVDGDFIVVGTHGRRGVERMLLGSVAEELIKDAHVPVVVAHPKDFSGLSKSSKAEAARPGEDLHSHTSDGSERRYHLRHVSRSTRISGLPSM